MEACGEGRTVLVVEDDASLRTVCRVNLELDGYRVLEAGTLDEAERLLGLGAVDALLLDVRVGDRDGHELLRALRADAAAPPVALFTGSETPAETGETLADGVLPKPFSLEQLAETVARLVSGRPRGDALP